MVDIRQSYGSQELVELENTFKTVEFRRQTLKDFTSADGGAMRRIIGTFNALITHHNSVALTAE